MPNHVYQRGAVFWWRRSIPRSLRRFFDFSEIRRSLRSNIYREATATARRLDVALDEVFETMFAFAGELQMLPAEAIHRIAREICDVALEQAERTRAFSSMRDFAEAETASLVETMRARSLRAALARNDYRPVAEVVVEALSRHGITLTEEMPDFRLVSRAVLRGMVNVHEINARRELGKYEDDDILRPPAPLVGASFPPFADGLSNGSPYLGDMPGRQPGRSGVAQEAQRPPSMKSAGLAAVAANDEAGKPDGGKLTGETGDEEKAEGEEAILNQPISEAYLVYLALMTGRSVDELSASIDENFMRQKKAATRVRGAKWGPDMEHDALTALRYWIEVCGNRPVRKCTKNDGESFLGYLRRLPRNHGKGRYARLSVPESVAMADAVEAEQEAEVELKLQKGELIAEQQPHAEAQAEVDRLSKATINKHLDYIGRFFGWLKNSRELTVRSPVKDLRYGKRQLDKLPVDQRPHYPEEDLRAVFASPLWTGCKSVARRSRPGNVIVKDALYWSVLAEAHGGLRLEEFAQLHVEDVKEIEGIWCFVVCDGVDRSTKTLASARVVPIHSLLIILGFLDFVARQKKAGRIRLFPELSRDVCHNRYGTTLTRRFSYYLEQLGLLVQGRVHHSARHTFDTFLQNTEVKEVRISELMGHARQGETDGRYYKGAKLKLLKDAIETIDYGLQLIELNGERQLAPAN